MTKCTVARGNPNDPNYEVTYDFELVEDTYSNWKNGKIQKTLLILKLTLENFVQWMHRAFYICSGDSKISSYDETNHLRIGTKPYDEAHVVKENHPLMLMINYEREDLLRHQLTRHLINYKWRKSGRTIFALTFLFYGFFLGFFTMYVSTIESPYFRNRDRRKFCLNNYEQTVINVFFSLKVTHLFWWLTIYFLAINVLKEVTFLQL